MTGFRIERLGRHDRHGFDCGDETLNRYFKTQITQDIRRLACAGFVVVSAESGEVAAYYTLSAAAIVQADVPEQLAKRLAGYSALPAVLLGRMAVTIPCQRQGLGAVMLQDAAKRARAADVAQAL